MGPLEAIAHTWVFSDTGALECNDNPVRLVIPKERAISLRGEKGLVATSLFGRFKGNNRKANIHWTNCATR